MGVPRKKVDLRRPKQQVSFNIPTPLLREIDALAVKDQRPRSQIMEMACRQYVDEKKGAAA